MGYDGDRLLIITAVNNIALFDYQVLNGDLRTSLAAVVAAINHAVDQRVQLISLSIGFVPTECDNIDWTCLLYTSPSPRD